MTGRRNRINKVNRKTRVIFRRICLGIVGLLLGFNLYLANAGGFLGDPLPMPFGYGLANVMSGSMEPTFSRGTLLVVKDTGDVQEGDIVVYESEGELIVHRVIALTEREVTTKGDANHAPDMPFDRINLKGKVIGWIPLLGSAAAVLKNPAVMVLLSVCAVLLIEGSFRTQKDRDERELEAIKEEIRRLKQELLEENEQKD